LILRIKKKPMKGSRGKRGEEKTTINKTKDKKTEEGFTRRRGMRGGEKKLR
jgi:hypothetical protein